jgi:hypothetical protein
MFAFSVGALDSSELIPQERCSMAKGQLRSNKEKKKPKQSKKPSVPTAPFNAPKTRAPAK